MATTARQQYFADESSLSKEKREFSIADGIQEKIDSVEEGAQVNKIEAIRVNGTTLAPDTYKAVDIDVPEVIDNLYTVDSDNALSAKQGKLLYDYIQNIASRGRFLSNWNSVTGLPMTNPSESPYPYKSGDYFVVSNVAGLGGTNYRPDGSLYVIGQASTVVEADEVDVSDFYFYDGTNWLLLKNSGRSLAVDSSLSTTSTNPVENRVITNAINGKQNTLIAGNNIQIAADGKTISATNTTYSAGANISINANNEISAVDTKYTAGTNVQISNQNVISATDTKYTAGTGINIDANNVISNTQTSAEWGNITGTLSDQTDLQTALNAKQDNMVILKYGISTWNDFITAYNKNGVIYCRASSNSNPASGSQTRLAFMAYVNNATSPTEVEFQYYRSRSSHSTAQNQQDEVYVYKLTSTSGGTWTVEVRDTAARIATGTGLTNSYTTSSGITTMTIANDGVLTVNGAKGTVTVNDIKQSATAPANPTAGTAWYDTTNGALKVYNGSAWDTIATGGAISDTAYGPGWDGQTTTAPSQNAVYDKISAMDTTISGKQDTLVSGTNIKTINNETLLGSGDISINGILSGPFIPAASATYAGRIWFDTMNNKFWKCDGTTWTEVTPVLSVNGGTGAITVNDVKVSATAPSSPTEGMVWYDATNDQLKVYDGSQWNVVGDDTANINTKTFYLTPGSSATAKQKGQECYDWYKAGNNPIVSYNGVNYHLSKVDSTGMLFKSENDSMSSTNASVSTLQKTGMVVQLNGDTVIGVSSTVLNVGKVLATDVNYSTVYTPQYDGSPATKKYVDDAIAGVGGGIEVDANSPIQLTKIRAGTQTEYDNLGSYDATTVYLTI